MDKVVTTAIAVIPEVDTADKAVDIMAMVAGCLSAEVMVPAMEDCPLAAIMVVKGECPLVVAAMEDMAVLDTILQKRVVGWVVPLPVPPSVSVLVW